MFRFAEEIKNILNKQVNFCSLNKKLKKTGNLVYMRGN